jgi:hypothetical protein
VDAIKKDRMFYFPLYALRYSTDFHKTLDYIISYCIVEYGYWLYSNFVLSSGDNSNIQRAVTKNPINNFDCGDDLHDYIVFASLRYGIKIFDIKILLNKHKAIINFISYYENQYGKDARVKVHRDLILETRDGKFDYNLFRLYCAVKSILGKKPFCRITSDRLMYRMLGYKSKEVFERECCSDRLLSRRKIDLRVNKLVNKKFVDTITYRKRIKFYSTQFKGKPFEDLLKDSLALSKANKLQRGIRNKRIDEGVDLKVMELTAQMNNGKEFSDIKQEAISKLNLVNEVRTGYK